MALELLETTEAVDVYMTLFYSPSEDNGCGESEPILNQALIFEGDETFMDGDVLEPSDWVGIAYLLYYKYVAFPGIFEQTSALQIVTEDRHLAIEPSSFQSTAFILGWSFLELQGGRIRWSIDCAISGGDGKLYQIYHSTDLQVG